MSGMIYIATNVISGKSYIGQTTITLKKRIRKHYKDSITYDHKFARALRRYNKEDWAWKTLYDNIDIDYLDIAEICAIYCHNTYCKGYNSTTGGDGVKNFKHSDYTRRKLSDINKGRKKPTRSKEHCKNISASLKGRKQTKEHARNAAKTRFGHEYTAKNYKITLPDGTIEIIKNLRKYCRENKLNRKSMMEVCKGTYKQHKGFRCEKVI